jgi:hypothetical protein
MRDSVIALAGAQRKSKSAALKGLPAPSPVAESSKPSGDGANRSGEHPRGHAKA